PHPGLTEVGDELTLAVVILPGGHLAEGDRVRGPVSDAHDLGLRAGVVDPLVQPRVGGARVVRRVAGAADVVAGAHLPAETGVVVDVIDVVGAARLLHVKGVDDPVVRGRQGRVRAVGRALERGDAGVGPVRVARVVDVRRGHAAVHVVGRGVVGPGALGGVQVEVGPRDQV